MDEKRIPIEQVEEIIIDEFTTEEEYKQIQLLNQLKNDIYKED